MAQRTKQVHSHQFLIFVNGLLALHRRGWEISSLLWRKYRVVNLSKLLKISSYFPTFTHPQLTLKAFSRGKSHDLRSTHGEQRTHCILHQELLKHSQLKPLSNMFFSCAKDEKMRVFSHLFTVAP